jgi:hypothetical protein
VPAWGIFVLSVSKWEQRTPVGWREWVTLPGLGIPALKAKVDTGARTSALHAYRVESFQNGGARWVRFAIHPLRKRAELSIECTAAVLDERWVRDSGGRSERRVVIGTTLRLGAQEWPIEITLTNRDNMLFRMLLGRTAMQGRFFVVPDASYLSGKALAKAYNKRPSQQHGGVTGP